MGTLKIHSENILPIIKKWLYSDKDIFVRELVSNSCDALSKLRTLTEGSQEKAPDARIDVTIDKTKRTLTFSDNGIGMTAEEVEKYIAQIAFSGAEEFVHKYQSNDEENQIIGHFGLGFYSSYMVAEHVDIQTRSYKSDAEPVLWSCDGSIEYTLGRGSREQPGTDIILTLAKNEEEYLEEARVRSILNHYCAFLPYPIYLNGKAINETPPLWVKPPNECTDQEYRRFYQTLFPFEPEPLFWIHLNVDYPFHLKGILYFPKVSQERELKKDTIKLFCNRVFVSDNCRDLLPEYLTILRGAIDSPDIPLNVSRSCLQMDRTVRQLGLHISKKISDRLIALYQNDKAEFISYWDHLELILKLGALQDEKFYERVQECLIWKNSHNEWTTVAEYSRRHPDQTIYYTAEEGPFLALYREKEIEVLFIHHHVLDQAIMHLLEEKQGVHFKRIDAHVEEKLLDPKREKSLLDANGRSAAAQLADFFHKQLEVDVEAKSLASDTLPAFLLLKEEERRLRDTMAHRHHGPIPHALIKPTLVVNTNSKLINAIHTFSSTHPELAKELSLEVYDLAKLSQKEMEPDALAHFITRSTTLLEQLVCLTQS